MHKLLLPFDGSESSLRAVDYVLKVAPKLEAVEINLINVQEEPIVFGEVVNYSMMELLEKSALEAGEKTLDQAAAKLEAASLPFKRHCVLGPIAETIAKYAEDMSCDSVVMGTRGMGALKNLLLGSITQKVIHLIHIPVTLVR